MNTQAQETFCVAYASEWLRKRMLPALNDKTISSLYKVIGVSGNEETTGKAKQRLTEIGGPVELALAAQLGSGIAYYHVNGENSLPLEVYSGNRKTVYICSKNNTHLPYITDAVMKGANVICEKPLAPILDESGNAYFEGLRKLKHLAKVGAEKGLVLMDSEHYSYKPVSLTFYRHIREILSGRKIKRVEGEIREVDNPDDKRTRSLLNRASRTGILTDTGVHLLSFISNLEGKARAVNATYGFYNGYDVETSANVNFDIFSQNGFFARGATAHLVVEKFIDKKTTPEGKPTKYIRFTLENTSNKPDETIELDFVQGTITQHRGRTRIPLDIDPSFDKNEYINILTHFNEVLQHREQPLTPFSNSICTLESLFDVFSKFPLGDPKNRRKVYQ